MSFLPQLRPPRVFILPLALILTLLCVATPLAADWIVLNDGTRIETKGEWALEDGRILFEDPQGRLSVLAADEVDLEASREASSNAASDRTDEAAKQAPAKEGSVLTLTDEDVAKAGESAAAPDQIVFYSTSWCGWCRKTRTLLNELGVPYVEKDIEKDPLGRAEFVQKVGAGAGVPVLDYNGEIARGFNERLIRRWAEQLEQAAEAASGE